MSEFSESFHFASSDLGGIRAKLEQAGMTGRLYGPSDTGWITYVPFEGAPGHQFLASHFGGFARDLSTIAGVPTLEYIYGQDHLWSAMLWNGGEPAAQYVCDWSEGAPQVGTDEESLERFRSLPARSDAAPRLDEALARTVDTETVFSGNPPAYIFAEALGLPEYQWLSSQYATQDASTGTERRQGIELTPSTTGR